MKKYFFSGNTIFSTKCIDKKIDINQILLEFHDNKSEFNYSHFINRRWENIYLNPAKIPSVRPLLSYVISKASQLYEQSFIVPHELLGFNKNEFWFNSAKKGESTRLHNHNTSAIISGVFYLQVPMKSGNLFFKNGNSYELEITPETGKLVLFPSQLDHYVPDNKNKEKRISISFNFYKFPLPR